MVVDAPEEYKNDPGSAHSLVQVGVDVGELIDDGSLSPKLANWRGTEVTCSWARTYSKVILSRTRQDISYSTL